MNFGAARAAAKKRKLLHGAPAPAPVAAAPVLAKKARTRVEQARNLRWSNVVLPSEFGFDEEGGLLELDEVDGVEVVYGEGVVTFRVKDEADTVVPAAAPKLTKRERRAAVFTAERTVASESAFEDEDLSVYEAQGIMEDTLPGTGNIRRPELPVVPSPFEDEDDIEQLPVVPPPAPKAKKAKAKKVKVLVPEVAAVVSAFPDEPEVPFDVEESLPSWSHLPLPLPIYRALHELKFEKPTAIQERALSVEIGAAPYVAPIVEEEEEWGGIQTEEEKAQSKEWVPVAAGIDFNPPKENLADRDLVGVAQTGSGKTLAYGLPILSFILSTPEVVVSESDVTSTRLAALILAPTRELALQVRAAIAEVAMRTNKVLPDALQDPNVNAPRKREKGRHISVVALTGGMSVEKQKRQLSRGADILVATPGRLWDLIGEDDNLARAIKGIKFLVIDEADRMIENGHFAELESIVRLTRRKTQKPDDAFQNDFASAVNRYSVVDALPPREDMRTFVFSATMSKDLQRNLKKRHRKYKPGPAEDGMSSLDDLLLKLDFRDADPELIDLSPDGGLVETLKECKIECMLQEKDIHLYHFLLRYPGRTIIFLSSIDGIRRLHPLLVLLGINVVQLHSGMQQRARLKSLDRFKASPNTILLATDVAARGLDIPSVSHVMHYQLPRSADVYVHRSGRTARAGQEGLAVQLVAPEEKQMQKLLMTSLGKDIDLPSLPTDFSILDKLKERIELAKKIESTMHKATKEAHEDNWIQQAAAAMDIEIDSDMELSDGEENGGRKSRKQLKSKAAKVKELKAELQAMLDKPLMMRGVSAKYITTRGRVGFVDQLVDGTGHATLLGIEQSTALADLPREKKRKAAPLV